MATLEGIKIGNETYDFPKTDAYLKTESDAKYATKTEMSQKQDTLTAGEGVTIENNVISASCVGDLPITKGSTTSTLEEVVYCNDAETEDYAKIGNYGIKAKAYYDMQGNPISGESIANNYNDVAKNKLCLASAINMIKNKFVNKENRCLVSFNGDSIIGSQLNNISHSAQYDTCDFPPNMSKNIMARKFYDQFKFDGEDTIFRNIQHSDWVKNGFNVTDGREAQFFNKFESMSCSESGETAEITITGYRYFKLVWSGNNVGSYSLNVSVSVDGGEYVTPSSAGVSLPATIEKSADDKTLQIYKIAKLNTSKTYKIKVTSATNPTNVRFWGCECWNNPRLDVVVQAYSGSRSQSQYATMQNAWYSDYHKPLLIISGLLYINDSSWINGSDLTVEDWMQCNAELYKKAKSNGIPTLIIIPHGIPNLLLRDYASGVPYVNDLPFIDMIKCVVAEPPSENMLNPADGLHLSDYGNQYYFNQLKKIFV